MKSSYVTNLLLLVVVACLFWFSQANQQQTMPQQLLSAIKADEIHQITIHKANGSITLSKQADHWQISHPLTASANPMRVNLLLSLLSSPVHTKFQPQQPSALAQFGLDQPQFSLSLNQHQFLFGDIEALSQNRYVMFDGFIYLIDDTITPILRAGAESFIENRLIAKQSHISKIELPLLNADLQATVQQLTLSKIDGRWQSDSTALATDKLVTLIDNWQHAQALQVTQYLQTAPTALPVIRIWLDDAADPIEFNYLANDHNLLLIKEGLLYHFPKNKQTQLFPTAE